MLRWFVLFGGLCGAWYQANGQVSLPSLQSLAPAPWSGVTRAQIDPTQIIGDGISNASAVAGFGYSPQGSQAFIGVALVIRTKDLLPYEHNIKTCRLVSDGALFTGWTTLIANGAYFPAYTTQAANGNEVATDFVAWTLPNGGTMIDSRHLATDYPAVPGAVDSVTVQLWAVNQSYLSYLLRASLALWTNQGTVTFNNTAKPQLPLVMIQRASHWPNSLTLQVMNYSAQTQPVTIIAERILTIGGTTPFVTTEATNVMPGPSTVQMALDSFIGATIYAQDANNARDQAYLGRAFQYFTDQATGGTSNVTFGNTACASGGANTRGTLLLMPGCASLVGTVQQYTGLYLPLGSYTGEVVALEGKGAIGIEFWAKSSIPFRVQVEDIDVHDNDFHGVNLPATPQWTKYDVEFSALTQRGFGATVPFTGNALQLSWVVPSTVAPANAPSMSFDMAIDGVSLLVRQATPRRPSRR